MIVCVCSRRRRVMITKRVVMEWGAGLHRFRLVSRRSRGGASSRGGGGGHVETLSAAARAVYVRVEEYEFADQSARLVVHDGTNQRHQRLAVDVDVHT